MEKFWQRLGKMRLVIVEWVLNQSQVSLIWISGFTAAFIALVLFWFVIDPAPPGSMRIATGSSGGFYERLGFAIAKRMERAGVSVEVVGSKGSVDNIGRLIGKAPVDAAFVQGGVSSDISGRQAEKDGLRSIASIAVEPLWLFTHNSDIKSLRHLRGRRIAAGPPGSGTRDLVSDVLKLAQLGDQVTLVPISGARAVTALQKQEVDVVAFVTAPNTKWVRQLVATSGVSLIDLTETAALARILPFATSISIPPGALDIANLKPAVDTQLIAVSTNIVVQTNLHPALKSLLLQVASEISEGNRLLGKQGSFPNGDLVDYKLDEHAKRYFANGPSVVRNYLPYWAANLVERFWILIIPLLTLILPLMRLGPLLYSWGMRRRTYRWYSDLADLERDVALEGDPSVRQAHLEKLNAIEAQVRNIHVPAAYRDDQYRLRLHIDFIKSRITADAETTS